MADLFALTRLVTPKCPGPVSFLVEDALAKVYREFCLRSEYLNNKETHTAIAAGGTVTLVPPANHYLLKVIEVLAVDDNGSKSALVPADVDYYQPEPGKLVIKADQTKLEITYSYCPTALFSPTTANDEIVNRWADELAAGAAAELRLMPGKEWSEPSLYDFYHRDLVRGYRDAMRARQEQFDDFQNYTRKHQFF